MQKTYIITCKQYIIHIQNGQNEPTSIDLEICTLANKIFKKKKKAKKKITSWNLRYHCLVPCFNPHKDFFNLQTRSSRLTSSKPSSCSMDTISSWSPLRKVILTSMWWSSKSNYATIAKINLKDSFLETEKKMFHYNICLPSKWTLLQLIWLWTFQHCLFYLVWF